MFNHSGDKPPRGVPSGSEYGGSQHGRLALNTSGQAYSRFGVPLNFGGPSTCPPPQQDSVRRDFDSSMDWTSPVAQQNARFDVGSSMNSAPQQDEGMELDEFSPPAGVSNLIARFEGIRAAPPSSNRIMSPASSVASPSIASPSSAHFGSMHGSTANMSSSGMSRITSPVAHSPATPTFFRAPESYRPPVPRHTKPVLDRAPSNIPVFTPDSRFGDGNSRMAIAAGPSNPAPPPQVHHHQPQQYQPQQQQHQPQQHQHQHQHQHQQQAQQQQQQAQQQQQQTADFSQLDPFLNTSNKGFQSQANAFNFPTTNDFNNTTTKHFATQASNFSPQPNTFSAVSKPFASQSNAFNQSATTFSAANAFSSPANAFNSLPTTNTFSPPPNANAFSPPPTTAFSPAPTPFSPATSTFSPAPTPAPSLMPGTPGVMQTPFGPPPTTSFPGHARAPSIAPTPKPATGSRPSREQVPAEAWESFKGTIKHLYLEERRPLKEVMQIMADQYGFQATPKMYKTRFSQWGFVKNNTEDEVKRLLSMKFQRDAEGKVSEFVRNGRVVNLGTYLKRKGVTEYDLVDFETPAQLPSYVRCRTPTPPPAPGYLRSPDLLRAQETIVGNMRKAFLHCRQFEVEIDKQVGWTSIMLWGAGSSDMFADANKKFEMGEHDAGGHQLMKAFKRLEMDLKQLSPQGIKELLLGMVHRDAGMMTALCKYLAAYSSTNFERSHPLRQTFSTLYEVQQKHGPITLSELVWGCIPTIAEELEAIYGRRHPYVARTWIDLAIFYNHANPERLEKLLSELQPLRRQIAGRHGQGSAEDLALRYAVVQLMQAAWPNADNTRMEALELWTAMKDGGLVFPVRGAEHNTFCYHSPLKIDPWERRCRERYDIGTQFFQQHCGIKVLPYFEEDMHYTEHAPDSHSALAAALGHMPQSKFSLI
ncbi:hypothetical protein CTAM01_13880 [Colletotrichum tamarilloi]|uniref:Clr5 domain-containing protein n=1 Tax=Colletotrichum tamarilloi TaxID=1209934 RepID=A0ABQ9QQV9_9PEZI|nr:uncharacterized protein CTAM01_13880 [Colletotrichum tamarilloi]KAI3530482.1 hypothetical protein CSPX01_14815 [Colletotrichum filicis]KAK1481720.1 hypothetical protein CTAM01_13880 [Colletotrichum tamarilloi]